MKDNLVYYSYSSYLQEKYGHPIYRVGVDGGFSCPNRFGKEKKGGCVYCDSNGATAAYLRTKESGFRHDSSFEKDIDTISPLGSIANIQQQIERGREFLTRRYKAQYFALYFQSFSNTFAPVKKLKEIYDGALEGYDWEELIVSTRPDCLDEEKCALLASYKGKIPEVSLEIGLQSGDDEILKAMNRGHDVQCFLDTCKLVSSCGLKLCVHVLFGFPNEGEKEIQKTLDVINTVHPNAIKIHNLNIPAGTKLYNAYLEGEVTASCATRHIENTIWFLRRIPSDIVIERLICETPSHRLASPRLFPDKNNYLRLLEKTMREKGVKQGDLWKK
ncbi:MAG: TIGR01212 family radical SAM protein [Sphaerochaetaceae bacterium]|nr:TIGR01212 family radical SAM protein [Sphaerochaetaceae bacterium]